MMWKRKILLLLCFLYVRKSLAGTYRPVNIERNYRLEGRRQPYNRQIRVTTTPKPILQQYWQSFVRNLPTLPPISWNITNPIGNIFNGNAQQFTETPVVMHMMEKPVKRKRKGTKPKPSNKNKKSINYYSTYDNSYQQMQLQPLGLDHNRVMHFYEPSSGHYYALQVESQPNYYNGGQFVNQYNNAYGNYYNQHNGYSGYEEDYSSNGEGEPYYQNESYSSEYGYDSEDGYDNSDQRYDSEECYDSDEESYSEMNGDYDNEYDNGVELADNWGYNDDDIFADRQIKGASNNLDTFAKQIVKIQKHLLKPETEEDVKFLFSKDQKKASQKENFSTEKETAEDHNESVRSVSGTFMNNKRKKQTLKTRKPRLPSAKPRKHAEYYIFPTNFWL